MHGILVFFHVPAQTGYAITTYERAFHRMACELVPTDQVHFAYTDTIRGRPELPVKVIDLDAATSRPDDLLRLKSYVEAHRIDFAFGVDQPVHGRPCYRAMRDGGVRTIVSYWGAPMSSPNRGIKLLAKRLEVALRRGPDHYIFESEAMRRRATHGRGVPEGRTTVVPTGIDVDKFTPRPPYDFTRLGIPEGRRVIFYSGHVGERRKGCDVLMRAAAHLAESRADFQFLICGNKEGEADWLGTHPHVTFGGYRSDLADIMPSAYLGAIASTGWDSFPVSSLELQACGVPVLTSDLDGTPETIEHGRTGYQFPSGDHRALAARVGELLDDPVRRDALGLAARERILSGFTLTHQTARLVQTCRAAHQGGETLREDAS